MAQVLTRQRVYAHPSRPNNAGGASSSPVVFAHATGNHPAGTVPAGFFPTLHFNPMPSGAPLANATMALNALNFNPRIPSSLATQGTLNPSGGGFWNSATGNVLRGTFPVGGNIAKTLSDIISGKSDKVANDALLTVTHTLPGHEAQAIGSAVGGTQPAKDLAKTANQLASRINPKHITLVGTGGIGSAGISHVGGGGPTLGVAIAKPSPQSTVGQVITNALKEAISIPGNLPTNIALTARHPATAVQQFVQTDPIIQSVAQGSTKPLIQHPLSAALDLSGAEGLVGRGLGIGARGAAVGARALGASEGSRLANLGNTARPSLELYKGTTGGPTVPRNFSPDLIRKQAQKALDLAKTKQGKNPNAASSRYIASQARTNFQLGKRVDEEVAMGEGARRAARQQAGKSVDQAFKSVPKNQAPAVALAVARILRKPETVAQDLRAFQAKASGADVSGLDKLGMAQRGQTLKSIEGLLKNEKFLANPKPVFDAAEKLIGNDQARRDTLIQSGLLKPEEAHAAHIPYAVTHMEGVRPSAQYTKSQPLFDAKGNAIAGSRKQRAFFLEDQHGKEVTPEMVKAHMQANGVSEPGFFSQQVSQPNAHFIPSLKGGKLERPSMVNQRRTGAATQTAAFDISKQALKDSAVRSEGYASAAKQFDHQMSTFGIHKPLVDTSGNVIGKRLWNDYDSAMRAGRELSAQPENGGIPFVPANVGRLGVIHDLLSAGVPDETAVANVSKVIQDAFKHDPGQRGQYVLVPEFAAKRLIAHSSIRGPATKWIQNFQKIFKETVLATSTKWVTGNIADAAMRSAANTIGPVRTLRGIKVLRELGKVDPQAAENLRQRTVGGTLFGSHEGMVTYKEPSAVADAPFVKQARGLWGQWKKGVFGMNSFLERIPQYGAIGKVAAQEVRPTMDGVGGFFKFGGKAFQQYVDGLRGTEEQVRTARFAEDVMGRWGKLSPMGKQLILTYFPFGQWVRVALKFVYYTLPVKHPVKTALIADLNNMNEQERKKLGVDIFQIPGFLGGSIPTKGGNIRAQNYTSFGVPSGGLQGLGSYFAPQYQGILHGIQGQDWKGQPLKDAHGKPIKDPGKQAWLALNQEAESLVPLLAIGHHLREQGGSPTGDSTIFSPHVKKGTKQDLGAALNKQFNPVRPIPKGPPKKPAKSLVELASPRHPTATIGGMRGAFNAVTGANAPFAVKSPIQQFRQSSQIAGLDKSLWAAKRGLQYMKQEKGKWVQADPTKDATGKWLRPGGKKPGGGFGGGVPGLSSLERQGLDAYLKGHGLPALPAQNKPTPPKHHSLHSWLAKNNLMIIPKPQPGLGRVGVHKRGLGSLKHRGGGGRAPSLSLGGGGGGTIRVPSLGGSHTAISGVLRGSTGTAAPKAATTASLLYGSSKAPTIPSTGKAKISSPEAERKALVKRLLKGAA